MNGASTAIDTGAAGVCAACIEAATGAPSWAAALLGAGLVLAVRAAPHLSELARHVKARKDDKP